MYTHPLAIVTNTPDDPKGVRSTWVPCCVDWSSQRPKESRRKIEIIDDGISQIKTGLKEAFSLKMKVQEHIGTPVIATKAK